VPFAITEFTFEKTAFHTGDSMTATATHTGTWPGTALELFFIIGSSETKITAADSSNTSATTRTVVLTTPQLAADAADFRLGIRYNGKTVLTQVAYVGYQDLQLTSVDIIGGTSFPAGRAVIVLVSWQHPPFVAPSAWYDFNTDTRQGSRHVGAVTAISTSSSPAQFALVLNDATTRFQLQTGIGTPIYSNVVEIA